MKHLIFGLVILTFSSASAYGQSLQIGLELLNSLAAEYHFDNGLLAGVDYPFPTEKTGMMNGYGTSAKLTYSPGVRLGWQAIGLAGSKGFILLSIARVEGMGTVTVNPANPSSSTSGASLSVKYSHRWYWERFGLGVGAGYRHNTISNTLVPYASQTFDIEMKQGFGPVFGEISAYVHF